MKKVKLNVTFDAALFEKIKQELDFYNLPVLKIHNFRKAVIKDLHPEQFVHTFITDYNYNFKTKNITKNTVENTEASLRSIQDIYCICKYYYPDITLEEVFVALFENCKNNNIYGKWFCSTILRYVFTDDPTEYDEYTVRDEKISEDGDILISDIYRSLGYTTGDFINFSYEDNEYDDEDDDDD